MEAPKTNGPAGGAAGPLRKHIGMHREFSDKSTAAVAQQARAEEKQFTTLAAEFARAGHALIRSIGTSGQTTYYCTRWGLIKPLADLDAARAFLTRIGGAA